MALEPFAERIHVEKYRLPGETFEEAMTRVARALSDNIQHFRKLQEILVEQRFLPGGRIQAGAGAPRRVTMNNCYILPIEDSFIDGEHSIMQAATEAAATMRMGGGVGYDFSKLRPRGALIKSLDSKASGPISFMNIFDSICATVQSAGHRRGAQMGVLRIDHPDIEEFIHAKQNSNHLTNFNISVGVTDKFMRAARQGQSFDLRFGGETFKTVDAGALWETLMRATWDWAEPGVLFLDTINKLNNLWYCENIAATNPCGEIPMASYGACLLGSFNLPKYVKGNSFDYDQLIKDIATVVPAMDNVVDISIYPLEAQRKEALNKRRMGIGVTGLANAAEILGWPYASFGFLKFEREVLNTLAHAVYLKSVDLATTKGSFPLYDGRYLQSRFLRNLDKSVSKDIEKYGIRNSHLTSIAPTGTISLAAGNVSSGIEPVFAHSVSRKIKDFDGERVEEIQDYAVREYGIAGRTSAECSAQDHLRVLSLAQCYMDNAVSKTCNVNDGVSWSEFSRLYEIAWEEGCKGITTFRAGGKRTGIMTAAETTGAACTIDMETGNRTCDA